MARTRQEFPLKGRAALRYLINAPFLPGLIFLLICTGSVFYLTSYLGRVREVSVRAIDNDDYLATSDGAYFLENGTAIRQIDEAYTVGIIVGHRDSDSGAVCDDGLQEVEVNTQIATYVAQQLTAIGVSAELLSEFDPLLEGYQADALISIHADSCEEYGVEASGFKLAENDAPNALDLKNCTYQAYAQASGLFYHPNTITPHMTDYHVFREIDDNTPSIIIETGFMNRDRTILIEKPKVAATGITNGIICFLENQP